jgi:hypothetical protein
MKARCDSDDVSGAYQVYTGYAQRHQVYTEFDLFLGHEYGVYPGIYWE